MAESPIPWKPQLLLSQGRLLYPLISTEKLQLGAWSDCPTLAHGVWSDVMPIRQVQFQPNKNGDEKPTICLLHGSLFKVCLSLISPPLFLLLLLKIYIISNTLYHWCICSCIGHGGGKSNPQCGGQRSAGWSQFSPSV